MAFREDINNNNNLFYSLPMEIQDKIIQMNPHPLKEIFKTGFIDEIKHYKKYRREEKEWEWYENHNNAKLWSKPIDIYLGYHCFEHQADIDSDSDSDDD